jgi:PadR family transcriptional regulator, regulatory protein AphA
MSSSGETRLTTTAYALLGLLYTRPYSPYELAQQMKRDLHFCWPRAERAIYYEPKHLVSLGLATSTSERTGKRKRTVYTITPNGRRAFKEWLEQGTAAPPEFECEALVRATFAHRGSKQAFLKVISQLGDHATAIRRQIAGQAQEYQYSGGQFPEQLHLIALGGRFLADYATMLHNWAAWAEAQVQTWPTVATASEVPLDFAHDIFREISSSDQPHTITTETAHATLKDT